MDTRVIRLNEQSTLTERFTSKNDVKEVYIDLLNRGYSKNDIKLLISEENLINNPANITVKKEKNEALSSMIGTIAGIILGIGLAAGLVIAGFDYAGLLGAGAAGIIGVIIGFIMIPAPSKESLKIVEPKTADDSILIQVNAKNKDDAKHLEDEWRTYKGKMVIATR